MARRPRTFKIGAALLCAGVATVGCTRLPAGAAGSSVGQPGAARSCGMAREDSVWLFSAIDAWQTTRERFLQLPTEPLPHIILFDRRCRFDVAATNGVRIGAAEHLGVIRLPNEHVIRVRAIGMTSALTADTAVFLTLALPEVWRTDPDYRSTGSNWHQYLTGAFIHELTHSRMLRPLLPRLREMAPAMYPDSIRDDVVQDRFGHDPTFASSVSRETEFLYRAATATTLAARVDFAGAAVDLIRARRNRFYVGDLAPWSVIEQTFLDLEGVAQWAAFSHARRAFYRRLSIDEALYRFRAGEQYWSQDQGLALFLALDALDPGWPARFFATPAPSSFELLAAAVASSR